MIPAHQKAEETFPPSHVLPKSITANKK